MSQYQSQKVGILDLIWYFKFHLVFYIVCFSFLSFATLYSLNLIPEELKFIDQDPLPAIADASMVEATDISSIPHISGAASTKPVSQGELPQRVIISKVGIDTVVSNPIKSDDNTLDQNLLRGAVRYPGSATLGQGNVFIFAHSTGLKLVNNQAFKAFNHIQDLNMDDRIQVQSAGKEYLYKVVSIEMIDNDKEFVDLTTTQNMLTLSTCNVMGEKQQRFVVKAVFVSAHNL